MFQRHQNNNRESYFCLVFYVSVCDCGFPYPTSPKVSVIVTESVDTERVWHGSTLCGHPDTPAIKFF
ncbi:hypothetical protein H8356DRAFT_1362270 [Neocallimastix lanati (nom. inval.)]|nr:hypothetical protein H8356DRAFT_1362270 [Neocallimastix sp. JGI-2020a]